MDVVIGEESDHHLLGIIMLECMVQQMVDGDLDKPLRSVMHPVHHVEETCLHRTEIESIDREIGHHLEEMIEGLLAETVEGTMTAIKFFLSCCLWS